MVTEDDESVPPLLNEQPPVLRIRPGTGGCYLPYTVSFIQGVPDRSRSGTSRPELSPKHPGPLH